MRRGAEEAHAQAERKLDGQWKLVYTSNSELFGLLALSRLPFVVVGDITQTVQASTLTVENRVRPLALSARPMLTAVS